MEKEKKVSAISSEAAWRQIIQAHVQMLAWSPECMFVRDKLAVQLMKHLCDKENAVPIHFFSYKVEIPSG